VLGHTGGLLCGPADADQPGDWAVMVRLRNRLTGTSSSDSPLVTVTVPT